MAPNVTRNQQNVGKLPASGPPRIPLGPSPNFAMRTFRDSSMAHVPLTLASRLGNLSSAQLPSTSTQSRTPVRRNPPRDVRMVYPKVSSGSSRSPQAASPPPPSLPSLYRHARASVPSNPHPVPAPPGPAQQGFPPPLDTLINVSSVLSVTSPAAYISDAVHMFSGLASGHDITQAGEQPSTFSVATAAAGPPATSHTHYHSAAAAGNLQRSAPASTNSHAHSHSVAVAGNLQRAAPAATNYYTVPTVLGWAAPATTMPHDHPTAPEIPNVTYEHIVPPLFYDR